MWNLEEELRWVGLRKSWQMGNNKQSILLYLGFNDTILWLWES